MLDLNKIQTQHHKWQLKNFPDATAEDKLLGMIEELGELCHAFNKGKFKQKYSPEKIRKLKIDAVGDIVIFLVGYCSLEGIDFPKAILNTWNEVKQRDYRRG